MSHIRKRNGKWQARMPAPSGGRPNAEVSKTFRTKQEAEDWLTSQRHSVLDGTYVDPRKAETPFAAVVDEWRASNVHRLSPTTVRRYEGIISKYLLPAFGKVPVGKIDHAAVQRYMDKLAAESKAPGTVRNIYATLRSILSKAVRLNLIKTNPCTKVDLPRARREEMLFLSAEEVRLVAEAIDAQFRVLVYFAAYMGLRAGELAGLRWGDVDLLRSVVNVRRSLRDVNGRLEVGDLKTAASRRTVSLPAFLASMLRDHLAAAGNPGPDDYVFTMKNGGPLRHEQVRGRYFAKVTKGYTDTKGKHHPGVLSADKANVRFHDLRHTCAALSIASGAHPKLIQARLGHSSITLTLDRYGHLFPSVEEALAEALDAAFVAGEGTKAPQEGTVVALAEVGG